VTPFDHYYHAMNYLLVDLFFQFFSTRSSIKIIIF